MLTHNPTSKIFLLHISCFALLYPPTLWSFLHVPTTSGGPPTERVPGNHDHHRMAAAAGSIHSFFGGLTALVFGFFVFRAVGMYIATKNNGLGGLMNSLSVSEGVVEGEKEGKGGRKAKYSSFAKLALGTSAPLFYFSAYFSSMYCLTFPMPGDRLALTSLL